MDVTVYHQVLACFTASGIAI